MRTKSNIGHSQQYGVITLRRARIRAFLARGRLPPGNLCELDVLERTNRAILLHQHAQHGPIFKVVSYDNFWVCIVGLKLARNFLRTHSESIQPVTVDLEPLVKGGFMRQMKGDTHRKYRRQLVHALASENLSKRRMTLALISSNALEEFAATQLSSSDSSTAYSHALHNIVTGMLIHIVFGAEPGSDFYSQLLKGYADLGRGGMAWTLGSQQNQAFGFIHQCLRTRCQELSEASHDQFGGLMYEILKHDGLDDTMLGNLIYMVEMGRDDATVLFRWLSKYACEQPESMEKIFRENNQQTKEALSLAFVRETLRTDQSYRLLRLVNKDISFENYFIPKNSMIRICMWESHRSAESFDNPFLFSPERFLHKDFGADKYSPFGIDQHQCPFSMASLFISGVFLQVLASQFRISAIQDGDPLRGPYHWEPARDFSIHLDDRNQMV